MKKVILKDDKNNIVHAFSFGSITCNHMPLDETEYEVVTDGEVECPKCIEFDRMMSVNAQILSDMIDNDILDNIDKLMSNE